MIKNPTSSLIVKLEGESSIDANTLINMLTHYVIITQRTSDLMGKGAYTSNVKVKAINKGSFEIAFEIVSSWVRNLITKENAEFAATLTSGVASIFSLYKVYKGRRIGREEAKEAAAYAIENNAETIIQVYNDPVVNEAFRKSFETAMNDEAVKGVTLLTRDRKTETIGAEEFGDLVIPADDLQPTERIVEDTNAQLSIISLSFNKGENWKFIYQGNKITTKLSDDGLQKAIDQGASFAKGDALLAELSIVQKWNDEYKAYVNQRYKIENVLQHIKSPHQDTLITEKEE